MFGTIASEPLRTIQFRCGQLKEAENPSMKETAKAMRRRLREDENGVFPWKALFTGKMLDVGCGNDRLPFATCRGFDKTDGDANHLSRYFAGENFDLIHESHVLEHMQDPSAALRDWLTLVKPGGWMVQTVPDVGAYERFQYPSRKNQDHKSSWSMIYRNSVFPIHVHIPTFLASLADVAEVRLMRYVEENFDWRLEPNFDQTRDPKKGVEIWNEFVLRKHG
jgi:predicted SAM-dependent methyltransferase